MATRLAGMMREVSFRHHGRTIRGDLTLPRQSGRRPAVLFVHGRGASRNHPAWWVRLRRRLGQAGFVVLRIDLSGHGASGGRFEDLTISRAAEDVAAALAYLKRHRRVNAYAVGAIGHSLGGAAVIVAQAHGADFKTLILLAAVADTVGHRRWAYRPAFVRAWRRRGSIVWRRRRDGHVIRLNYGFYRDLAQLDTVRSARTQIHQPVLAVHGTRDDQVAMAGARRFLRALDGPTRLLALRGADHNFVRPAHTRAMLAACLEWLGRYLAPTIVHVVNVYVRSRGELLILKRSKLVGQYRGAWAVIGGHLQPGDDPLDHAYVELREEAGLTRRDVRLVRVGRVVRIQDERLQRTWVVTPVLVETRTRRIRRNWEHVAHRWIRPERFPFPQSYPHIRRQFEELGLA